MADVDQLVAEIRASKRYRHVSEEMVRRISEAELRHAADLRAAVKATKRKLHQAVGAFGGQPPPYDSLCVTLRTAAAEGTPGAMAAACRDALRWHASTRERIPILADLYREVFALTGRPRVIVDLGCGLGPLALPWMGLPSEMAYHAYDVDEMAVGFVNSFFELLGLPRLAEVRDVLTRCPTQRADVALLLKMVPTLEQQEEGSGRRLLDALDARFVVVSFPVRSLGGREKGMVRNYQRQFHEVVSARDWPVERLLFETELVYVVDKYQSG